MTTYFGVKCTACRENIALVVYTGTQSGREVTIYFVPLEAVICPKCGHSQQYGSEDSLYFDGPGGLL